MSNCGSCDVLGRDRCPTHRPATAAVVISTPPDHKCRVRYLPGLRMWVATCGRCAYKTADRSRDGVFDDALGHWYFTREVVT